MFDVDWSDPHRESVGDRRARKVKEKDKTADADDHYQKADDQDTDRNSGSITFSESSSERQFRFFGSKHRKKSSSASRKSKAKSLTGSSLRSPTIDEQPQAESRSLESTINLQTDGTSGNEPSYLASRRFSGFADSIFTKADNNNHAPGGSLFGCDITNPQPGSITLYQELGDGVSMVIKTTVVLIRERMIGDGELLVSKVYISAGDFERHKWIDPHTSITSPSEPPTLEAMPWNPSTKFNEVVHLPLNAWTTDSLDSPKIFEGDQVHNLPAIAESSSDEAQQDDLAKQKKLKRNPRPLLRAPAISPANLRPAENPETWKAPNEWAINPAEAGKHRHQANDIFDLFASKNSSALALDIARLQQEVDRMIQATPYEILGRLRQSETIRQPRDREEQQASAFRSIYAVSVSREQDMETQRWLLSAIYNMETIWDLPDQISKTAVKPKVQKVLALFESQATTSYLAAVHNTVPVCHLSPDPLDHKQYPNVYPTICPSLSASAVKLSRGPFSVISCIPLISILPSPEIPRLLDSVYQALVPGGFLHLVVIDPWPVTASMGPRLQRWVDENLVFNLELQFRCTHPGRMLSVWLQNAGLRGPGSIITHTRFHAIPSQDERSRKGDASPAHGESEVHELQEADDEEEQQVAVKKELRSTAGRMLWRQIWSPFVSSERWWWEDPEIVEECIERQTYWEYKIIAACKASEGDLVNN